MRTDCFHFCPEAPEWRRSGRFFLLALALHAVVLFVPLQRAFGHLEAPPPDKLLVKLVEILPVAPAAPPSESRPAPSNAPRQHPVATPRPVLAMAPEQSAPAANWSVPVAAAVPLAAAPAAPAATNGPAVAQLTPARYDAAYLHNPPPKYPPLSRRLGEEGRVLLKVRVTPEGMPAAVDLEKGSNFERLDEAARQVVGRWRFVPAKRGEEAVEALVIVPVVFRLDE